MAEPFACPRCGRESEHLHCQLCGRDFTVPPLAEGQEPPVICGFKPCVARHEWTPDEWAGRARMAAARADAGIGLDDIDREALARAGADAERGAA